FRVAHTSVHIYTLLFLRPSRLFFLLSHPLSLPLFLFFFFNDPAPTEIYTLSLHDALPISRLRHDRRPPGPFGASVHPDDRARRRSEEHTSELQSQSNLVCRLLLEKKKKKQINKKYTNKKQIQLKQ